MFPDICKIVVIFEGDVHHASDPVMGTISQDESIKDMPLSSTLLSSFTAYSHNSCSKQILWPLAKWLMSDPYYSQQTPRKDMAMIFYGQANLHKFIVSIAISSIAGHPIFLCLEIPEFLLHCQIADMQSLQQPYCLEETIVSTAKSLVRTTAVQRSMANKSITAFCGSNIQTLLQRFHVSS